jgi:hypothetical protein
MKDIIPYASIAAAYGYRTLEVFDKERNSFLAIYRSAAYLIEIHLTDFRYEIDRRCRSRNRLLQ